jgi:2-oxoglutarate ferredoxin oxidoreductase subunit alpha
MLEAVANYMIDFTLKIGGAAGFGIKTTGDMFSKTLMRAGFNIFSRIEYPSLIRGGHNVVDVRVSEREIFSQKKTVDILIALNRETVDLHKGELAEEAVIIYDADQFKADGTYKAKNVKLVHVPLLNLVKKAGGEKVMENNVALGASLAVIGIDLDILFKVIKDQFGRKGKEIVRENHDAAKAGYNFIKGSSFYNIIGCDKKPQKQNARDKILLTGNDAVALGAIAGGCKLYCAYPMTPASSILHTLAALGDKVGMLVRHAEDEIAVVNLACGAGFAGARTMIGTSGGGLSLMVEGLGLVGLTETPLVIVDAQRPGPATGMPTWTGQGDLRFVLHAHQDDFPRIVLAPGDVEEAFELTWKAFNYAEKYQTAVFVLLDKYLSESHKSVRIDAGKVKIDRGKLIMGDQPRTTSGAGSSQYLRYKITGDGIPPRAIPGLKNTLFTANSYEHNEYGLSSEDPNNRIAQVNRRNKKLDTFRKNDLPEPVVYGEKQADLTLIGWGSTKGPALQAIHEMEHGGNEIKANYLHINYIWPFPKKSVEEILKSAKKTLLLEGNHAAELGGLIAQETGVEIKNRYLKYDGRPFYPSDIIVRIKKLVV